jgi:hypothetical protein
VRCTPSAEVGDELGAHVIGERPPHDAAAGEVDDGGEVGPALPGGDVGDVATPAGVELGARAEVPVRRGLRPSSLHPGRRTVVLRQRGVHRPARASWAIRRATRFLPTYRPWLRYSSLVLGSVVDAGDLRY